MRFDRVTIALAVLTVFGCCVWAPWVQVDSSGPSEPVSLGFAPLWSSGFRNFPGAKVDMRDWAMHVAFVAIIVALVGLGRAMRRNS
jgi:hypothetical protein